MALCKGDNRTKPELAWLQGIPEAPTFRPTEEEFADPLKYINGIRAQVRQCPLHALLLIMSLARILAPCSPRLASRCVHGRCGK